jgi:hypothetical protein
MVQKFENKSATKRIFKEKGIVINVKKNEKKVENKADEEIEKKNDVEKKEDNHNDQPKDDAHAIANNIKDDKNEDIIIEDMNNYEVDYDMEDFGPLI